MAPVLPAMAVSTTSPFPSSLLHLPLPPRSEPTTATTDSGDAEPHDHTADIAIICAWILAFILIEIYIVTHRRFKRRIAALEARIAAERADRDVIASGANLPEYTTESPSSTGAAAAQAGTAPPPAYAQHHTTRSRRHAQHRDDERFYGFSAHVDSSNCRCGSCGDDDVVMPIRVEDLLAAQKAKEEANAEKEKGEVTDEKKDPVMVKTTEVERR